MNVTSGFLSRLIRMSFFRRRPRDLRGVSPFLLPMRFDSCSCLFLLRAIYVIAETNDETGISQRTSNGITRALCYHSLIRAQYQSYPKRFRGW